MGMEDRYSHMSWPCSYVTEEDVLSRDSVSITDWSRGRGALQGWGMKADPEVVKSTWPKTHLGKLCSVGNMCLVGVCVCVCTHVPTL